MKNDLISNLHKKQLEILIHLDKFCRNNNIQYMLYYGTELGAVREKGFIPWDDDVDVAMTRNNFDKFIKLYKQNNNDIKFFLQTKETDNEYALPFARLRNSNTTFIQEFYKHLHINHGIFIDIFVIEPIPKNFFIRFYQKIILKFNWIITRDRMLGNSLSSRIIKMIINPLTLRQKVTIFKHLQKKLSFIATFNFNYYTNVCEGMYYYEKYKLEKAVYDQVEEHMFEDKNFYIMKNYDIFLNKVYGDYMTPPPINERLQTHGAILIDFEKSYQEYERVKLND